MRTRRFSDVPRWPARCLVALVLSIAIAACASHGSEGGSESSDDGYPPGCYLDTPSACPATPPSWTMQVQPIINATCALGGQCHGTGGAESAQYDYTTYAGVKKAYLTMEAEVEGCQMPPAGAAAPSDADWVTLIQWFECGAPNN
jgi:hypothetical protein